MRAASAWRSPGRGTLWIWPGLVDPSSPQVWDRTGPRWRHGVETQPAILRFEHLARVSMSRQRGARPVLTATGESLVLSHQDLLGPVGVEEANCSFATWSGGSRHGAGRAGPRACGQAGVAPASS
jgi:hypothetical protein